jgi:hypothetical protein
MPPRQARRARMRRMGLLLAALAVGLVVAGEAALAATRNRAGDCSGTSDPDCPIDSNHPQIMLGFAPRLSVHEASKKGGAR